LAVIAQQQQLNIVTAADVTDTVSVTLHDVPLENALDSLMAIAGCTRVDRGGIIFVSKINAKSAMSPDVQGRKIRVLPLNFIAASDIQKAVEGLLSPAGQIFFMQSDPSDKRKTRDQLVIEDLPGHITRIADYVAQVDRPPQQVLIEVHILQVKLTDEIRHGVNFEYLQKISGKDLALATVGFADPLAATATLFSVQGNHLGVLLEALKQTTDAKTLASPKVMVVNGQRAKIQIGERLGYLVTTTTQTSTLQNVQFLDVGVVLEVTPQITADGQVLMHIKPKVSGGQVVEGLPEEETTEVDTTVMLPDGQGIIIGGLIQELDDDRQSKIPIVGDFWLLGRLFQRRLAEKERTEIIIALVPRIVPLGAPRDERAQAEWTRAATRLFEKPLDRTFRPQEPGLPDAVRDPRRLRFDRLLRVIPNLGESHPLPSDYILPPASKNPRVRPTRYP
ncbi:MAG: type II secretion system protein GspD, partial [Planctomycetaceae bacterium]